MTDLQKLLAHLREVAGKRTPGPWNEREYYKLWRVCVSNKSPNIFYGADKEDADFAVLSGRYFDALVEVAEAASDSALTKFNHVAEDLTVEEDDEVCKAEDRLSDALARLTEIKI